MLLLSQKCIELAKIYKCDGLMSTGSHIRTQKVLLKLGFEEKFRLKYTDFEVNGKKIMKNMKPLEGTEYAAVYWYDLNKML